MYSKKNYGRNLKFGKYVQFMRLALPIVALLVLRLAWYPYN